MIIIMILQQQRRMILPRSCLVQLSLLFLITSQLLIRQENNNNINGGVMIGVVVGDDSHQRQTTIITKKFNQQQQQQEQQQKRQQQYFIRSPKQQQQQKVTNDTTTTSTTSSIKVLSSSTSPQSQSQSQIQQSQSQTRQLSLLSDFLAWLRKFIKPPSSIPSSTTNYPPAGTTYTIYPASRIATTLLSFQQQFPNYITVTTSQKQYGLPTAYDLADLDCPFDGSNVKGCLNYYAIVQDYIVHPIGSDTSNSLPTVLFSGAVHGNERVGPTAVLEATKLLLLASSCENLLANNTATTTCRTDLLNSYGIKDEQRQWLARLVTTRRIIVVPTANALGYYKNVREEGNYDPNRDFPFDILNNNCMKTIAGRTLNEIFRNYIIQLSLTYHAGTEVIAYEWGTQSYYGYNSPDDIGQNRIVKSMQQYAGQFNCVPLYDIGQSNYIIYPVRGGMEDWAYAGSWDPSKVPKCNPTTYGGYDVAKTTYGPADLRDFNILVETSIDKTPPGFLLGTNRNILNPTSNGNGHVPRNIRLTLLATELVEPYILIKTVNGQNRTIDLIPGVSRGSCRTSSSSSVVQVTKASNPIVTITWIVGGALVVDSTKLWYSKWTDVATQLNCSLQPPATITTTMKSGILVSNSTGVGRYSTSGNPTLFQGTIDLSQYNVGDEIIVLIEATVDQQWKQNVVRTQPNVVPQSHIVNIRTNTSWYYKNTAGFTVQGRTRWFSIPPVTITIQ